MSNVKVVWSDKIGKSPAAINRVFGILYLHPIHYRKLSLFNQKFVYWHEIGHYVLNTSDEIKADAYAFDKLAGTEFRSLKQCLTALSDTLDFNNPTLRPRYKALVIRALRWDYQNGNAKAGSLLNYLENGTRLDSVDGFKLSIGGESEGDRWTKIMQMFQMDKQQEEASRINDRNARKSQQNLIMLIVVAVAVYYFIFKEA